VLGAPRNEARIDPTGGRCQTRPQPVAVTDIGCAPAGHHAKAISPRCAQASSMPAGRARARGRSAAESIDDAEHSATIKRVMAAARNRHRFFREMRGSLHARSPRNVREKLRRF
jgi:hypothetical protein